MTGSATVFILLGLFELAMKMVVSIEEIRDEGLDLAQAVAAGDLAKALSVEGRDTGFRVEEGLVFKVHLEKVSGGVLLEGSFDATLVAPCKRCLADVKVSVPASFTLNLVPERVRRDDEAREGEDDDRGPRAGSFSLQSADEELFDGKRIDLSPILREQVLLALPMNVVCREDCLGLCSQCGQNLNEKRCGCDSRVADPRFEALKQFKLN